MSEYTNPASPVNSPSLSSDITISVEEKEEIFQEIDRVVNENKINHEPSVWRIKAMHNGANLPIILNILILIVVVGGLFSVFTFFKTNTIALNTEESQLLTAEARLLEEIKKESELAIGEKDREIADIQVRLASIDQEKAAIMTEADAKVQAKIRELEQRLQEELSRERLRLAAQGLSPQELESRIQAYADRRKQEIESELQVFRAQADVERRQLERALNEAQEQYQRTLDSASSERQRIQAESAQKEAELQARQSNVSTQLEETQAQLARLESQNHQAAALESQVSGLIREVRDHFTRGEWAELKTSADAISQVASLPAYEATEELINRRTGHLLLTQTLNLLADSKIASLTAAEQNDGNSIAQALALQNSWSEAEVLLRSAESDWNRENYDAALEKSSQAFRGLGLITGDSRAFFRRWLELGGKQILEDKEEADTATGRPILENALSLAESSPTESRELLVQFLESFPLSSQRGEALTLLKSLNPLQTNSTASVETGTTGSTLASENQNLKNQVAQLQGQIQSLRSTQTGTQETRLAQLQTERDDLLTQLNASKTELTEIQARLSKTETENQALNREKTTLSTLAGQFTAMRMSYDQYSESLRLLNAERDLERKQLLNGFLADASAPGRFELLQTRVQTAISEAKTAGQTESMYYAADIMEGTHQLTDDRSRRAYFTQLKTRFRGEPAMLEFLNVLEKFSQPASE